MGVKKIGNIGELIEDKNIDVKAEEMFKEIEAIVAKHIPEAKGITSFVFIPTTDPSMRGVINDFKYTTRADRESIIRTLERFLLQVKGGGN